MPSLLAEAHVETDTPAWYITRLCKHFAHKADASFTDDTGEVHFPFGSCTLEATSGHLRMRVTAETAEDLEHVQDVLENHLRRFAEGREEISASWTS